MVKLKENIFYLSPSAWSSPVTEIRGIGDKQAGLLGRLRIKTLGDLLCHWPHRYLDYRKIHSTRELSAGPQRALVAQVAGWQKVPLRGRKALLEMLVQDEVGRASVVWFHYYEASLKKQYPVGTRLLILGDCRDFQGQYQFVHPTLEKLSETQEPRLGLIPVYPLTEGLTSSRMVQWIQCALELVRPHIIDSGVSIRDSGDEKISFIDAVSCLHQPPWDADVAALNARSSAWHQRIIYDELFFLQLGLAIRKNHEKSPGAALNGGDTEIKKVVSQLPFRLTGAQVRSIQEIQGDLQKPIAMNRLLMGDVGSGKTIVAYLAMVQAAASGYQSCLMAPTEVLAQQHFSKLGLMAEAGGFSMAFLGGKTPASQKQKIIHGLATGDHSMVVGTHALIQESVNFRRLGLAIVDEQHRFGVEQRSRLRQMQGQESSPHMLGMSATPIPRTLAMISFGDLEISRLDEYPAERKTIKTEIYFPNRRSHVWDIVRSEVVQGHQVFVVCPLIEENEELDLKAASQLTAELRAMFPQFQIECLHGRMKSTDKDAVMLSMIQGKTQILVSTTVIEVGIDIPNATLMVVEQAERFGLAQLHQLRGRVGRSSLKSQCFLLPGNRCSFEARERLALMTRCQNGFELAEADLKLRGPGEVMGTKQSGMPEFRMAELPRDEKWLHLARQRISQILAIDPLLTDPKHQDLQRLLAERWSDKLNWLDIA